MKITKLQKEALFNTEKCRVTVEITVDRPDGYDGFDIFPDESIPDLLVAIGRMYKRAIKDGKLNEDKVSSLLP